MSQFLLSFDLNTQKKWFSKVGLKSQWWLLAWSLLGGVVFLYWRALKFSRKTDPMTALLDEARTLLAKKGINTSPWEGPATILNRLQELNVPSASQWESWLLHWQQSRYGAQSPTSPRELKKSLRVLR